MDDLFKNIDNNSSGAIISNCEKYRYHLWRIWNDSKNTCTFIMLNPSTANAYENDNTIRRCIKFAMRENCGAISIINLFAYRSPYPEDLKLTEDPIGPLNDKYIIDILNENKGPVIAAWGAKGTYLNRNNDVSKMINKKIYCLSITNDGHPGHPLYLKSDSPLIRYN